jgi:superfamily I DNA/RNA helicase
VIVAHNGYAFDFPVMARMAKEAGLPFDLCTFDTLPLARDLFPTSRKLVDLARQFGIPPGQSHRALDDSITLAHVMLELERARSIRARKTALVNLLDHLGAALAFVDDADLCDEARMFRDISRVFALGRYSSALDWYERERAYSDEGATVEELMEMLGGVELMLRLRADRSADERYPAAMARLRRVIDGVPPGSLDEQLRAFLEIVALSSQDGLEASRARVNLLTLHSTKGLEFSRVYIIGAENAELPGSNPKPPELEEARRLLYEGMTRTINRLIMTHCGSRSGKPSGGHRFLDEMSLVPTAP